MSISVRANILLSDFVDAEKKGICLLTKYYVPTEEERTKEMVTTLFESTG